MTNAGLVKVVWSWDEIQENINKYFLLLMDNMVDDLTGDATQDAAEDIEWLSRAEGDEIYFSPGQVATYLFIAGRVAAWELVNGEVIQ